MQTIVRQFVENRIVVGIVQHVRHETVGHRHTAHRLCHLRGNLLVASALTRRNGDERHDRTVGISLGNLR